MDQTVITHLNKFVSLKMVKNVMDIAQMDSLPVTLDIIFVVQNVTLTITKERNAMSPPQIHFAEKIVDILVQKKDLLFV